MEKYRAIEGYPRYAVSTKGNVKNIKTGKVLSQRLSTNGYKRFNVRTGDVKYEKPKTLYVHQEVAKAFIEPIEGKEYVNHIDGDKTNNHVENLEWVTSQENSIHAYETIDGLKETYRKNLEISHERAKKVIDVWKHGKYLGRYKGKQECAKALRISPKTIYNGLNNKYKSRLGYEFREVVSPWV